MRGIFAVVLFLLFAGTAGAQTNPCDTNATGPFVVQSAKSFTVQWCTAQTQTAPDGTVVPERIDGFYIAIDQSPKQDIGKATSLGASTVTKRDAWQYQYPSGVSKGDHTIGVQAWHYVLDSNTGQPTTTRAESPATAIPFSAVDPVYELAPQAPTGGRITR